MLGVVASLLELEDAEALGNSDELNEIASDDGTALELDDIVLSKPESAFCEISASALACKD